MRLLRLFLIITLLVITLGASLWWAGWFGLLMGVLASLAITARFLNRSGILSLPGTAEGLLSWATTISVLAILVVGAVPRIKEYAAKQEAERLARKAAQLDLTTTHYTAADGPLKVVAGKNEVGLPPGSFTGCIVAPRGFYFSGSNEHRFDRTLETRADCNSSSPGWVSTAHSQYRPRSISVRNNGREAASITVWMLPDWYSSNG